MFSQHRTESAAARVAENLRTRVDDDQSSVDAITDEDIQARLDEEGLYEHTVAEVRWYL